MDQPSAGLKLAVCTKNGLSRTHWRAPHQPWASAPRPCSLRAGLGAGARPLWPRHAPRWGEVGAGTAGPAGGEGPWAGTGWFGEEASLSTLKLRPE